MDDVGGLHDAPGGNHKAREPGDHYQGIDRASRSAAPQNRAAIIDAATARFINADSRQPLWTTCPSFIALCDERKRCCVLSSTVT